MDIKNKYSEVFKTRTKLFRYNYETQKMEELKKVIRKVNQGGIMSALVLLEVMNEFEIDGDRFQENPQYWVELCDSTDNSTECKFRKKR